MKTILQILTAVALTSGATVFAQIKTLQDINTVPGNESGSNPDKLVAVNNNVYFAATSASGRGLWTSNGTPEGTTLIKIITPTSALLNVNGVLYFSANDGVHGEELWKSDGTATGTVLLKDINPGNNSSSPGYFANIGDVVYFSAANSSGRELWKTDGTPGGTQLVKDIHTSGNSDPVALTNVNGVLFFSATDAGNGKELWKSDGTTAGTVLIKDIYPGTASSTPGGSSINNECFLNVNGQLFFTANNGTNGSELWKSDGTPTGTVLIKDIAPGTWSGIMFPSKSTFKSVNGILYFIASTNMQVPDLWKSDGTNSGTVTVKDNSGIYPHSPSEFTVVNNTLFFSAYSSPEGTELWKSDGTVSGTKIVKEIVPGGGNSNITKLADINGVLFFSAADGSGGTALWKSNGTAAGTVLVKNIAPDLITNVNGVAFFKGVSADTGKELWKSEGTAGSTVVVKDIFANNASSNPRYGATLNGYQYLAANNGNSGGELWKTDGLGVAIVKDIFPGAGTSMSGLQMVTMGGVGYFSAFDGTSGTELWRTDGTSSGTTLVKDIYPGINSSGVIPSVVINNNIYFVADNGVNGRELWKSDGTAGGTLLVKDISPGIWSSNVNNLTNVNGVLYFSADNGESGNELWKSDGTAAGTVMVKDIISFSSSFPLNLTASNNVLYFVINHPESGVELWKSNGTESGTMQVKDIVPGIGSSNPTHLFSLNGTLFFSANDGVNGYELWKSDGTSSGTTLVKDINPIGGNGNPNRFINFNGEIYFMANDGTHGEELWKSNGTQAGTTLVRDLVPGSATSVLIGFNVLGNSLYFVSQSQNAIYKTVGGEACGTVLIAEANPLTSITSMQVLGTLMIIYGTDPIIGNELFVYDTSGDPTNPCMADPVPITSSAKGLFNGVIASVRWRTDAAYGAGVNDFTGMYTYNYDDKYQVKEANWANPLNLTITSNRYRMTGLSYDPNGNILSLRRYSHTGNQIQNFVYSYNSNTALPRTNQLENIPGYSSYQYNKLGQLIKEDKVNGDDKYVDYDVSGKVTKVFSDAAKQNLKVEFIYDERGFRLAKVDLATSRTTWYIRDTEGKVIDIYEQDGLPGINPDNLTLTETPIYGAGKLGTYYASEHGSTAYEITDHLGNVRALVKERVLEFTATIEDNGMAGYTNPRVQEMAVFNNLFETEKEDARFNHTPGGRYSSYLYWRYNTQDLGKSIGPATFLKVQQGDTVRMETWVRYENKTSFFSEMSFATISQFLGNTFAFQGAFEGMNALQTANKFGTILNTFGNQNEGLEDLRPIAFLNYIILDENADFVDAGWEQVPYDAGFNPGEEALPDRHKKVSFDHIVIPQKGYIYIWVSNEGEDSKVWFDDLKITRVTTYVSQATDYGVWGDVLREQKTDESEYRFGYQGQFAEKDKETGWNHFELREYDPVIGRWLQNDPEGQYWSPYVGMGNNPISRTDPNGGHDNPKNWFQRTWNWLTFRGSLNRPYSFEVGRLASGAEIEEMDFRLANNLMPGDYTSTSLQNIVKSGSAKLRADIGEEYVINYASEVATGGLATIPLVIRAVRVGVVVKEGAKVIQYTKSSLSIGQRMHKAYKAGLHNPAQQMFKEYILPSGRRIDFLDAANGIIYELKPFNPRAMKAGQKQLNMYMKELQTMPEFNGINWRTILETY